MPVTFPCSGQASLSLARKRHRARASICAGGSSIATAALLADGWRASSTWIAPNATAPKAATMHGAPSAAARRARFRLYPSVAKPRSVGARLDGPAQTSSAMSAAALSAPRGSTGR